MPRCNKCPIQRECRKQGKLGVIVTDELGKKKKAELCPLLFAVNSVIKRVLDEAREQSENSSLQTEKS